jgi:hypothetical protein
VENPDIPEAADVIPEDNIPPAPRHSMRAYTLSAASTASRGEACERPLDRTRCEVQESAERKKMEKTARRREHANTMEEDEDYLFPTEMDDPRTFKQVMATKYAPQQDTGYDEEMSSLKKHNVWTLIPHSDVPTGRKVVGSRPHFHTKRNKKGEIT